MDEEEHYPGRQGCSGAISKQVIQTNKHSTIVLYFREKHPAIKAGIDSGFYYYEGYDPFEIAFTPGAWKGPWRNIVEVDEHYFPTKKFFITNDHYKTIKGPYYYNK